VKGDHQQSLLLRHHPLQRDWDGQLLQLVLRINSSKIKMTMMLYYLLLELEQVLVLPQVDPMWFHLLFDCNNMVLLLPFYIQTILEVSSCRIRYFLRLLLMSFCCFVDSN
jgi:hypothetical protein